MVTTIVRDGQSVDTAAAQSTGLANGRLALVSSSTTSVNTLAFSDLKWQVLVSFAYLSDDESRLRLQKQWVLLAGRARSLGATFTVIVWCDR